MTILRPALTTCRTLLAATLISMPSGAQTTNPTLTTLYSFSGGNDGLNPLAGVVIGKGGVLYGTTYAGGNGGGGACSAACGTVFSLSPPASRGGSWTETVLYAFTYHPSDGALPVAGVVIGNGGVIYGTTYAGGRSGFGTVFSLSPPASPGGSWTETVLHDFNVRNGSTPSGGVVIGRGGVLYGTTFYGGKLGSKSGTVFSLTPPTTPGGPWTETVLHSFGSGSDGSNPAGSLVIGENGVLFGTTVYGGTSNLGTVFSLTPPAGGPGPSAWHETVLYNFTGGSDGSCPYASMIIGKGGTLHSTTEFGGSGPCSISGLPSGCGTVFSLTPHGGEVWTEAVLHSFRGPPDGLYPRSRLVMGDEGVIYGTAGGGISSEGLVFSLTPPANGLGGAWTEIVLHRFTGGIGGGGPEGGVTIGENGVLYGTTQTGGTGTCPYSGCGTVFSLLNRRR